MHYNFVCAYYANIWDIRCVYDSQSHLQQRLNNNENHENHLNYWIPKTKWKKTHTTRIKNRIQLRFNQILATRPRLHCSNDRHIICCLKCYANMYDTQNICCCCFCCCCSSNTTSCVCVVDGSFWSHWNFSNSFDFFPFWFWIPNIAFRVYLPGFERIEWIGPFYRKFLEWKKPTFAAHSNTIDLMNPTIDFGWYFPNLC